MQLMRRNVHLDNYHTVGFLSLCVTYLAEQKCKQQILFMIIFPGLPAFEGQTRHPRKSTLDFISRM